ncbi:MAG: DNA translocase FtsK, partial [Chloroflexota bacterium]
KFSIFVREYRSKGQWKSASYKKNPPSGVYSQGQNNGLESRSVPMRPTARLPQTTALPQGTSQAICNETLPQKPEWVLPDPRDILDPIHEKPIDEENDQQRARVIEESLRSFGAPAHVVEIRRGPSITLFGVEPDFIEGRNGRTRVRVSRITSLADDLAMALKASRIRIQAPVPGKGYVGIEVPNREISLVSLSEIISSSSFTDLNSILKFALGKDVSGNAVTADLSAMPHLLIAGTTGSGKSVCINAILTCYLLFNSPDQLRLVLVDPKRVELTGYNGIPHLLSPVIVDADRVVGALQWMMREMDVRYHKFSESGTRNIGEYNAWRISRNETPIPYLLVVIDELADLMMLAPDETERALTRLAQLARATGIHLILATQRPSTDILTGLIKANFPARIAFAVASGVDSRVILDQPGAERLLGRGDMLFQAPDAAAPVRLQGTYVSDNESSHLASFWRQQTVMPDSPTRPLQPAAFSMPQNVPYKQESLWEELQKDPDEDPMTTEAIAIIRKERRASISMLQRKLRIGYTRAARMIEALESKGIIDLPNPQTKVREVLDYGSADPPTEGNQPNNYKEQ